MRIRFLSDQIYETGGPGKGPSFPAGYVLDAADVAQVLDDAKITSDWAEGFLRRWTQRAVAEEVDGRTQTTLEADKAAPAPSTATPATKPKAPKQPKAPAANKPLGETKRGRATKGLDDGKPVEKTDLTKLTLDELKAIAGKRSIDVGDAKTEADFIAAIELAEEAPAK